MDSLDFVPYETAKKLKAAGFDWTCQRFHTEKIPGTESEGFDDEECMPVTIWDIERTPIPTLWHAQKWLREKKEINVLIGDCACGYYWEVSKAGDEQTRGTMLMKSGRPFDCRRTKHHDKCPDYEPKENKS